jgi:hypothetical protein
MTATPATIPTTKGPKSAKRPAKIAETAPVAQPAPTQLKLPDGLRSYHDELVKALATPVPAVWDDAVTYSKADQPKAVAKILIRALHSGDCLNAKLEVVFRKRLSDHGKQVGAKASTVGGKLNYFTDIDLLIEVNHEVWLRLTPERRIALIDHELCHFTRHEDEGRARFALLPHDVEEFGVILRRWGLWEPGLERFASSVEKARQLDIFAAPIAAADSTVN